LVVWKVCVDRESGMPEGPESGMKGDVYTHIYILHAQGNPSFTS
jgi:hypothetical protein